MSISQDSEKIVMMIEGGILILNRYVILRKIAHIATEYPKETTNDIERSNSFRNGEKESNNLPGPKNKIRPKMSRNQERSDISTIVTG
jgi:hypothetical protein